jgi:hypothetical protein
MPTAPASAQARAASGASAPSVIVAQPALANRQPTATTRVGAVRLDAQVRLLTSLSLEEVAELARAAADNCEPRCETNFYEPGTWQYASFNDGWLARRRELQQWELQGHESE